MSFVRNRGGDRGGGASSESPLKPREQPRREDGGAPEWCSPLQRLRATEQKSALQALYSNREGGGGASGPEPDASRPNFIQIVLAEVKPRK